MFAASLLRDRTGQARLRATRGQALVELAIFGSVLLAALAFLIRIGMTWNFEQEVRMAAFRRALAAAHADNAQPGDVQTGIRDAVATTFHSIADRQMPNPSDGFMSLPRVRTEASAFVEWGNRLTFSHVVDENDDGIADSDVGRKTQQLIAVRANENEVLLRQDDFPRNITFVEDGVTEEDLANRAIVTESVTRNLTGSVGLARGALTALEGKAEVPPRSVPPGCVPWFFASAPAELTQTSGSSTLESRTVTESVTFINTVDPDEECVGSLVSPPATKVNW